MGATWTWTKRARTSHRDACAHEQVGRERGRKTVTLTSKDKLDYEAAELVAAGTAPETQPKVRLVWGVLRLMMGFTFLWAFLDKLLALGFATGRNPETGAIDFFGDAAWINGASPTEGFLSFALHTKEPFLSFYEGLAGSAWVDWIYMLSMAGIGIALILGVEAEAEEALGRRSSVDPGRIPEEVDGSGFRVTSGGKTQCQKLVEERPQEGETHHQAKNPPDQADLRLRLRSRAGGNQLGCLVVKLVLRCQCDRLPPSLSSYLFVSTSIPVAGASPLGPGPGGTHPKGSP